MLYIRAEDFYEEARSCSAMSRQEELQCARQMREGDALARERLIRSYLPMTAAYISRMPAHRQSLRLILDCRQALEKAVDAFDFLQDSEPFSHRLNWYLRSAVTKYIADR